MNYTRTRPKSSSPSLRVLVVDDDAPLLLALERGLERAGFNVQTAVSGEAAIEELQRDEFDVVFLDVALPGLDGIAVAKWAREAGIRTPIVAFSGGDEATQRPAALDAGMQEYVRKPSPLETIRAVLQDQAKKGSSP